MEIQSRTKVADVLHFIRTFKAGVALNAHDFNLEELCQIATVAKQNDVFVFLRDAQFNAQALTRLLSIHGKKTILDTASFPARQSGMMSRI